MAALARGDGSLGLGCNHAFEESLCMYFTEVSLHMVLAKGLSMVRNWLTHLPYVESSPRGGHRSCPISPIPLPTPDFYVFYTETSLRSRDRCWEGVMTKIPKPKAYRTLDYASTPARS